MKKTVGRPGQVILSKHRDETGQEKRHTKRGLQTKKPTHEQLKKRISHPRKIKGRDNLAFDSDVSTDSDSSIEELQEREIILTIATGRRGKLGDLGFELMGGNNDPDIDDDDPGIYVQDVNPEHDVAKAIDSGDQILKIGGHEVTDVPLHHALNLIRAADSRVVLNVLKHPDNPMIPPLPEDSDDSGPELDEEDLNDEIGSTLSRVSMGTVATTMMVDETDGGEEVEVGFMSGRPGQLDDLDFEFAGGKNTPSVPRNGGIFITSVKLGSVLEEHIAPGDKIIQLEGVNVTNVPKSTIVNLIRASHGKAKMIVRKAIQQQVNASAFSDDIEVCVNALAAKDELIVEIKAGPRGRLSHFGFKVTGGRDKPCRPGDPGVFIKQVKPGSRLEKILKPGDKILKVQGKNVINATQSQVMDMIKAADQRAVIHIKRSSSDLENKVRKPMSELFEPSQLEEFLAAFELYNNDIDQKLNVARLPTLCRALGFNFTGQDLEYMTTHHDNGSGRISFHEFLHMIADIQSIRQKDRDILEAFEIFDRECLGFFVLEDLKAAFRFMPGYSSMTEEEMEHIMNTADSNGDGKVYYQDFKDLVLPIFHKYSG